MSSFAPHVHTRKHTHSLTQCDGLSENVSHRLTYLNTLTPVYGAVWGRLWDCLSSLEEAYPWEWTLRINSSPRFQSALRFVFVVEVASCSRRHTRCLALCVPPCRDGLSSPWSHKAHKPFLLWAALIVALFHSNGKVAHGWGEGEKERVKGREREGERRGWKEMARAGLTSLCPLTMDGRPGGEGSIPHKP